MFLADSCAVQADPLGGPADTTAPLPDSLLSTPNQQVFFEKQPIELVFKEWVVLKNQNQIIVSPPLKHDLKVDLKRKTLVLEFDKEEELLDSTTYTINLGGAIEDYSASNSMDNYTFVFSTGSFLDSLEISGKVIDDYTGNPSSEVIVAVYADLQDSAAYKQSPLYFTKTDESGAYNIKNIRKDSFQIVAINDNNLNYYKDQESEKIGFFGDAIYLDSTLRNVDIGMFEAPYPLRITSKIQSKGELKLTFNRAIDSLDYLVEGGIRDLEIYINKDTAFLWHNNNLERELIINPKSLSDTIILKSYEDEKISKKENTYTLVNASTKIPISSYDSLIIDFNAPVKNFDADKFAVIDTADVRLKADVFRDKKDPRILKVVSKWVEGQNHQIEILPEAIETNLGVIKDSINAPFIVNQKAVFGEIALELDSLNKEISYIVEITESQNKITRFIKNKESYAVTLSGLKPGKYEVRLTEDLNGNGRWDPGDFFRKERSERWLKKTLEPLKPNWTLDVKINGDEFK